MAYLSDDSVMSVWAHPKNVKRFQMKHTLFENLLEDQARQRGLTDVILNLSNSVCVPCHRFACSSATKLMDGIDEDIVEDLEERRPTTIYLPDTLRYQIINQVLRFLYLGEVVCFKESLPEFEAALDQFGVDKSKINCVSKLFCQDFPVEQIQRARKYSLRFSKTGVDHLIHWDGKEEVAKFLIEISTETTFSHDPSRGNLWYCTVCGRTFTTEMIDNHFETCPKTEVTRLSRAPEECIFTCKNCLCLYVKIDEASEVNGREEQRCLGRRGLKRSFEGTIIEPAEDIVPRIQISMHNDSRGLFCPSCQRPGDGPINHSTPFRSATSTPVSTPPPVDRDNCFICETSFAVATSTNNGIFQHFAEVHNIKDLTQYTIHPEPKCRMCSKREPREHRHESPLAFLRSLWDCKQFQKLNKKKLHGRSPAPLTVRSVPVGEKFMLSPTSIDWWKRMESSRDHLEPRRHRSTSRDPVSAATRIMARREGRAGSEPLKNGLKNPNTNNLNKQ